MLINRQDALNALKARAEKAENHAVVTGIVMAMNDIRQLPPAQQWIPCSERLPEDVEDQYGVPNPTVLFCTRQYVYMGYYSHGAKCWWTRNGYLIYDVVAWMETPEPYKRGDEDD